jgi:hypothetical protein
MFEEKVKKAIVEELKRQAELKPGALRGCPARATLRSL